jgi:SAM-dependent methyltransferase
MSRIYSDEAELCDIAFDWDISGEVDWLLERLGPDCYKVLEPGCGSGRMLDALAGHGLEVTGIDVSEPMLELARRRLDDRVTVVTADDCLDTGDLGRGDCGLAVQRSRNLRRWPQGRLAERASHRDRWAALARARSLRISSRGRRDPSSRPGRTPS